MVVKVRTGENPATARWLGAWEYGLAKFDQVGC